MLCCYFFIVSCLFFFRGMDIDVLCGWRKCAVVLSELSIWDTVAVVGHNINSIHLTSLFHTDASLDENDSIWIVKQDTSTVSPI